MSKELTKFKKHFEMHTSLNVLWTLEERHCSNWKRLMLPPLNCDELKIVSDYIRETFSSSNTFSHRLPKLQCYRGDLCLTVDIRQINEFVVL